MILVYCTYCITCGVEAVKLIAISEGESPGSRTKYLACLSVLLKFLVLVFIIFLSLQYLKSLKIFCKVCFAIAIQKLDFGFISCFPNVKMFS